MATDIRQLARLQQILATNLRLAAVVLRSGEPPRLIGYSGGTVPSTAAPLPERELQLIAQAPTVPGPGEAPAAPPAFLVRGMEYLQRFYEPESESPWRFRATVTRNGGRLLVHLGIVRPASELDGVMDLFVASARMRPLEGGKGDGTAVTPAEAVAALDDGLLVVDAPSRPLGQLYGAALLRALTERKGGGTLAVQGVPLFDLPSSDSLLLAFSVPEDVEDPLAPLRQPHLAAVSDAFYTDLPEAFEGSENLIPRLAGKAVVAVSAGKLRGVEALVRKYGKERTRVLSVIPRT